MNNIDNRAPFIRFNDLNPYEIFKNLKTPCYIIDELRLIENGKILKEIQDKTSAKILLAEKAFSNYDLYNVLEPYLAGTEASGLFEARLGREEMPKKEVHVFSAAYRDDEFDEILKYADHIVFNSINQLRKFGPKAKLNNKSVGIRINPEKSTQKGPAIYDPCSINSRLGIPISTLEKELNDDLLGLIDGIHFHTLCQQNSDDLKITLDAIDQNFSKYFKNIKWINFGGGHHITREDYDIDVREGTFKYLVHLVDEPKADWVTYKSRERYVLSDAENITSEWISSEGRSYNSENFPFVNFRIIYTSYEWKEE